MVGRGVSTILVAVLCGLLVAGPALAQNVPLPTPAPRPKTGSAPPPPAAAPENKPGGLFGSSTPSRQSNGLFQFPFFGGGNTANTGKTGTAATAFDAHQRALVDKVSAYLSSVQTMVGNFVQVGPDGGRTEGTFYIQKPGKVRFEYNAPSPIDIVADGSSVIVRDRKLATQDLYPLSQTPLRYLLAERIDLLRDTDVVSVTADDTFISVIVEEKQAVIGTSRLTMMFDTKSVQLKQWTVTDPQGYDTTVAVYNLDTAKKPDPNMFVINYQRNIQ
jgi:outer membrane lipoprotein-sorting protein